MPVTSRPARDRYRRGLMTSVVNNSSAFGFSVMITTAYGMLGTFHGSPSAFEVTFFALGAVLAVAVIEAVASRGFRRRPHTHPEEVLLLGTAANLVSVAMALAVDHDHADRAAGPLGLVTVAGGTTAAAALRYWAIQDEIPAGL